MTVNIISYNPKLKKFATELRNNASKAEVKLWLALRNRQLGVRFVRQKMISNFIVDFYCKELRLIIEVDDISHDMKERYDFRRSSVLKSLGMKILRYKNEQVMNDIDDVISDIKNHVPTPAPPVEGMTRKKNI